MLSKALSLLGFTVKDKLSRELKCQGITKELLTEMFDHVIWQLPPEENLTLRIQAPAGFTPDDCYQGLIFDEYNQGTGQLVPKGFVQGQWRALYRPLEERFVRGSSATFKENGWAVADGSNGTQDLTNDKRFVKDVNGNYSEFLVQFVGYTQDTF